MSELLEDRLRELYLHIRAVLTQARARAWQAVNSEMVACYWEIGRLVVQYEQRGKVRAGCGKRVLHQLSERLTAEFGKGFDRSNLQHMRSLYLIYPICDALRRELTWTHYRLLLRIEKQEARAWG